MTNSRKEQRGALAHGEDIGIADIWKFLIRRRLIVAVGILVGGILAVLAYVKAPRLYTATVTVEMNREGSGLPDLSGASALIGEDTELMTDMLTHQAVLMSDSTAVAVIKRLNLMATPPYNSLLPPSARTNPAIQADPDSKTMDRAISIFKGGLRTAPVKNTRLLAVSYTDKDPERAAMIANTIVEAYLENHTKSRYDATAKTSTWLTDQLDQLKRNSETIHAQVAALEKKSGSFTTPLPAGKSDGFPSDLSNSSPEYQRLFTLNEELSKAEILRIEKEAIYRLADSSDPEVILGLAGTRLATEAGGILDPNSHGMQLLQSLRTQEAALKIRLSVEQVKYGPDNPIILETQKQLDSVRKQSADELGHLNAQTKADYLLAKANEDALRKNVEEVGARVAALGDDLTSLSFLREEELGSRRLYEDLYRRLEEANIAAGVRSSGMAVDDPARVPSGTSSPILKSYLTIGLGAGLLAGIVVGLLLQARDTLLYTPEDFQRVSPFPMLGIVPGFDSPHRYYYRGSKDYRTPKEPATPPVKDQAWILRAPKSQLAEAYRQIRTSILLSSIDNPPRVILVTSAASGDGKTTTAYNLAAAFASQSSNVLLIGADMRRPSVHKIVGVPSGNGLSDVLSNRVSLEEAVIPHPLLPSLKILMAGTIPPDPAELLGSKRFAELIQSLRTMYEYIVIDAPPVLPVTDPVVAAASADAVLAVVRAGKTRKPDLKEMWASLDLPSINILAFMVNGYDSGVKSYSYEELDENKKKHGRDKKESI